MLSAAEHASAIKDSYASEIQGALSGFAALLADPASGAVDGDRRALLVSDLHDNTLALTSLGYYAQGQPVFFVGDVGNTGVRHFLSRLAWLLRSRHESEFSTREPIAPRSERHSSAPDPCRARR